MKKDAPEMKEITRNYGMCMMVFLGMFMMVSYHTNAQESSGESGKQEASQSTKKTEKKQAKDHITRQATFYLQNLNTGNPYLDDWSRRQLIEMGDQAVPILVKELQEGMPPQKQYLVCEILGETRSKDEKLVDVLVKKLKNMGNNPSVASASARALGMIGVHQERIEKNLIKAIEQGDTELTYNAIWALGTLRSTDALEVISDYLEDDRITFFKLRVQNAAIEATGKIATTEDHQVIRTLRKLLNSDSKNEEPITGLPVQFYVVRALEQIYGMTKGSVMAEKGMNEKTIEEWNSALTDKLPSGSDDSENQSNTEGK